MGFLSKTAVYGIRAAVFIANESSNGKRTRVSTISEGIDAPMHFTAKIVQQLAKNKILNSVKGPNGGFIMTDEQRKKNTIKTIVEALDGDELYHSCGLGLQDCQDKNPCPIHEIYGDLRKRIIEIHTKNTIDELAQKLDNDAVLKLDI